MYCGLSFGFRNGRRVPDSRLNVTSRKSVCISSVSVVILSKFY